GTRENQMRKQEKGFTLMELMVVIVIVAIIAAAAVPLYINYVNDAKRTEAKGAVGAVITAEQTYFQKQVSGTPSFTTNLAALNVDLTDMAGKWTLSISSADATSFTVLATGSGTNAGHTVQCVYTRGGDPVWTET